MFSTPAEAGPAPRTCSAAVSRQQREKTSKICRGRDKGCGQVIAAHDRRPPALDGCATSLCPETLLPTFNRTGVFWYSPVKAS